MRIALQRSGSVVRPTHERARVTSFIFHLIVVVVAAQQLVQVPQIYPASPIASHIQCMERHWRCDVTSRSIDAEEVSTAPGVCSLRRCSTRLGDGRSQQITHFLSLFHSRLLASARRAVKGVACTSVTQLSFLQFSFLFRHKMAPLDRTFSICYCQTKKTSCWEHKYNAIILNPDALR